MKTKVGISILLSKEKLEEPHKVFNLEVYREHNFLVSESGVLVHNSYLPEFRRIKHDIYNELTDLGIQKEMTTTMKKGIVPPKSSSGVVRLDEIQKKKYPAYTHKIKIKKKGASHYRVLGKIEPNIGPNNGPRGWFDKIINE